MRKRTETTMIRPTKLNAWLSMTQRNIMRDRYLYLLLIPFILWYIVFQYKPMYALQIAFKDYSLFKGIEQSPWIGLENFSRFYHSEYFFRTIKNTLMINIYQLLFAFPIPIVLAILLNEAKNIVFRRLVQTLTYLPHFISVVIVAGLVTNFLSPSSGLINIFIEKLGGEKIYFLTIPEYFRAIFISSMDIWKEAGFGAIIYIAAIAGVNPALYEAAVIDGASKFRQIWHITIPSILPTIIIMLILKVGSMMDVGYEAIILLYQPSTYAVSDVINSYVYRAGIQGGEYDLATAVGLFNGVVGLILVYTANRISNKITQSGLW